MKQSRRFYNVTFIFLLSIFSVLLLGTTLVFSYPVEFADSNGNNVTIGKRPSRVVSLVPSITEIIFRIGAGDAVRAVTYHDTYPSETSNKEIIGGFFSPSLDRI